MADRGAPYSQVESNSFSNHAEEKKEYGTIRVDTAVDEDEEADMDALIEELESHDPGFEEEEEDAQPGGARTIPEELLQTSMRDGLTAAEVLQRRRKYGLNQMKEEKENLILKFLGFFIGPIQFVMEVSRFKSCKYVS